MQLPPFKDREFWENVIAIILVGLVKAVWLLISG